MFGALQDGTGRLEAPKGAILLNNADYLFQSQYGNQLCQGLEPVLCNGNDALVTTQNQHIPSKSKLLYFAFI